MILQIEDMKVHLYFNTLPASRTPLVLFHALGAEAEQVWEACQQNSSPDFCLAAIEVDDWEQTLSPWPAPRAFHSSSDFGSGADEHIRKLERIVVPSIKEQLNCPDSPCYIAGYSFAGLFALYTMYKTDLFAGAVSASGSLWFPGFLDFARSRRILTVPESPRLYLSLGDKECRTRNPLMRSVETDTQALYEHYRSLGLDCIFEKNPGNHFQDVPLRMAKGIRWILSEKQHTNLI